MTNEVDAEVEVELELTKVGGRDLGPEDVELELGAEEEEKEEALGLELGAEEELDLELGVKNEYEDVVPLYRR